MSKRMEKAYKIVDRSSQYTVFDAMDLLFKYKSDCSAKFDESIDLVIKFGLDMNKPESMIRTFVDLPNGNGKKTKVIVFTDTVDEKTLLSAGAVEVGGDDLIAKISTGEISSFDKCVATTSMMPKLAKIAKILGPKGLMPSQKTGTVVSDNEVVNAVSLLVRGRSSLKVDKDASAKLSVGKLSFSQDSVIANLKEVFNVVKQVKPINVKTSYIQGVFLSTTMGFSVSVKVSDVCSL